MKILVSVLLFAFSVNLYAQDLSISDPGGQNLNSSQEILFDDPIARQAAALEIRRGLAPIKSEKDLVFHLLANSEGKTSPLHKLSEESLERFVESLTFTENGLASYGTRPLISELASNEIYDILRLFGVQYNSPLLKTKDLSSLDQFVRAISIDDGADHEGYRCESRGTCVRSTNRICTSNC